MSVRIGTLIHKGYTSPKRAFEGYSFVATRYCFSVGTAQGKDCHMKQFQELGNVCEIFSGSRPKGGAVTSGILSIGGEHINADASFNLSKPKFIPSNHFKKITNAHLKYGDILLVKDGATTGKIGFFHKQSPFETAAINEYVFILRLNSTKIIPLFLYYYLRSNTGNSKVLNYKVGSAQGGVNLSIKKILIPLPSIEEQTRIVSILEKIDDLRKKQKEALELTRKMIPALFHEMFGDINKPSCKIKNLSEAILISNKKINPQDQFAKTFYYLGLENIEKGAGKIIGSTQHLGSKIKSSKNAFEIGDVLYGKLRPYLNKVCLPKNAGICSTDILVLKPRQQVCIAEFLYATLQNSYFVEQASSKMQGANLPRISPNTLLQIPILLPEPEHQRLFAKRITEIYSLVAQQESSLQKLDELFDSTLHQFFS